MGIDTVYALLWRRINFYFTVRIWLNKTVTIYIQYVKINPCSLMLDFYALLHICPLVMSPNCVLSVVVRTKLL